MAQPEKPNFKDVLKEMPWIDRSFMLFFMAAGLSLIAYGLYVVGVDGLFILLGVIFLAFFSVLYSQTSTAVSTKLKRQKAKLAALGPEPSTKEPPQATPLQTPAKSMPGLVPQKAMPQQATQNDAASDRQDGPKVPTPDDKPKNVQQNLLNDMFKKM